MVLVDIKAEHILVMEKKLGRKLKRNETPHHIDESFIGRSNNDLSNLELMTRSNHVKHHMKGKYKLFDPSTIEEVFM